MTAGGVGGRYLLDEYRRGACGTMPACEVTDAHVAVWNALESGDQAESRRLFRELLPLLNIEAMYSFVVYKEVLYRRGTATYAGGFLDGVFLVDLAPVLDAKAVPLAIADTLQAGDEVRAAGLDGLKDFLMSIHFMVGVDNQSSI